MAATGFTPISLYYTTTAAAVPTSGNLIAGELALNTTDEKLYFKNTVGAVKLLCASLTAVANGGTGQTSYTDGQLLIGNSTGNTLSKATLTAGSNISITNSAGGITIAATGLSSGTVTSVSVVSANGLAGTVANATTTPAITLSTSITGILKGDGTAISAATAGTDYVTPTGTTTLTNKRITARVNAQTTTTSPWAWNSDSYDQQSFTALANDLTISADAGTPTDGQKTVFRFEDNGTARVLTWTTGSSKSFRAIGVTLPTTTVIGKTLYVGCIYNTADSRWDAVAVAQEA